MGGGDHNRDPDSFAGDTLAINQAQNSHSSVVWRHAGFGLGIAGGFRFGGETSG